MKDSFKLEIVTPEGMIFSGDIKYALFPGSEGELGILPAHASLITLLRAGVIEITNLKDEKEVVAINWGYLKVEEEKTSVLADGAVYIQGSDDSMIAKSLQDAKELLKSMSNDTSTYASTIAKIDNIARSK